MEEDQNRKGILRNLKNRNETNSARRISLLEIGYTSTRNLRINISIVIPTRPLWVSYDGVLAALTGKERGTLQELLSGTSVSESSKIFLYMSIFLVYLFVCFLLLKWPERFDEFWTAVVLLTTVLRAATLFSSKGEFRLLEFQYIACLTQISLFSVFKSKEQLLKLVVPFQLFNLLSHSVSKPTKNAITFTSPSSFQHLHNVFTSFIANVALLVFLQTNNVRNEEQVFQQNIVQPTVAYLSWGIFYLFITEVIFSNSIYSKRIYSTEIKEMFSYYDPRANQCFPRNLIDVQNFCPEMERTHHAVCVSVFVLTKVALFLVSLPLAILCMKQHQIYANLLLFVLILQVFYGARLSFASEPVTQTLRQSLSNVLELNEGGDEINPRKDLYPELSKQRSRASVSGIESESVYSQSTRGVGSDSKRVLRKDSKERAPSVLKSVPSEDYGVQKTI